MDIVESGMRDAVFTKVDLVVRCVQGPPCSTDGSIYCQHIMLHSVVVLSLCNFPVVNTCNHFSFKVCNFIKKILKIWIVSFNCKFILLLIRV